ncbi:MAG: hypothetical protein IPO63_07460 [Bacteroidetes bacterium]|nr:hypothetical protein [Bacteroidota bacterium]
MIKRILFLLILAIPTFGFSQKCQVTKDPITGEKMITAIYQDRWVYMENKGEETKLSVLKGYMGELNVSAPIGSEFIIKLDNDEIFKINDNCHSHPK